MAEEINVRVKHKGMTSAEWKLSPVILLERELGVATDTGEVRVGNGTDKWANLPIIKGAKGDQGESVTVSSKRKDSQGNTIIEFSDGETVTIEKGDKGDSITVSSHTKDGQGNTVINFSDGSNVTVDKGDSIKVESTSTDSKGNTLVKFSDGSSATISKGEKGDPLKFEDLTQEQINQIKAKDVDMSNYATKDDLAKVDVSEKLSNYAKNSDISLAIQYVEKNVQTEISGKADKNHNHSIFDLENIGSITGQIMNLTKNKADKDHKHSINDINSLENVLGNLEMRSSLAYQGLVNKADKNHTHDEYFKKGDPIELTSSQKAELKGERGASGTSVSIRSTSQNTSKRVTTVTFSNGTSIEVPWGKDGTNGARGQQGLTGQPGKGIVNTRTGSELKYWCGSQADYNKISTKDSNTIYDVWE